MTNDGKDYGTSEPQRRPVVGSHDDPVVVDNGPTRVDFGDGDHDPL